MATNPGQYNGNQSPLLNFADTFSWTVGRHAFKFGAEINNTKSKGYSNITAGGGIALMYPIINGGAGNNPSPIASVLAGIPNFQNITGGAVPTGNRANASNLELFLAGAVNNATQIFWIDN